MRALHVLVWLVAASAASQAGATSRSRDTQHARSAQQQPRGHGRRSSSTSLVTKHAPASSAALIEGSDETIETYSKHQPGRHVCTQEQAVTEPVRTRESYCRPVYKTYSLPCEHGKMCRRFRVVYETAYRDVLKMRVNRKTSYTCCPGWSQGSKANHGCTKAVCSRPCQNGGACLKPDFCGCRPGFVGKHCEQDLDECALQQHSCQHLCINTAGSYQCRCREGFTLQPDARTCVLASHHTTAVPAVSRDREEVEDDDEERDFSVEYVNLTRRINKLEKLMTKHPAEQVTAASLNDVTARLEVVIDNLAALKSRVDRMERRAEHQQKLRRNHAADFDDPRMQTFVRQLAVLQQRMDACACTADSANKINL